MINLRQTIARPDALSRPVGDSGKELISVRGLLEWAFGVEHAGLDFDEIGSVAGGGGGGGVSMEYRIMQQLALGTKAGVGVRVDTSFGRSHPADDADLVASVLRNSVRWSLATRVAELARAGRVPEWGRDAVPHCRPREWRQCKHGLFAKTERVGVIRYRLGGRARQMESRVCPVVFRDTAADIARRRRAYLDWWGALLMTLAGLRQVELRRFELTDRMPPMEPWKGGSEKNT